MPSRTRWSLLSLVLLLRSASSTSAAQSTLTPYAPTLNLARISTAIAALAHAVLAAAERYDDVTTRHEQ